MRLVGRSVVALALALGVALLLRGPVRELRREVLLGRALDALVEALERRDQSAGHYVDEPFLSGGELAAILVRSGHLAALPRNPDTGRVYGEIDLEVDLLFYEATGAGRAYALEALSADGATVVAVRRSPDR